MSKFIETKKTNFLPYIVGGILLVWGLVLLINAVNNYQVTSSLSDYRTVQANEINADKDLMALNELMGLSTDQQARIGTINNLEALVKKESYFSKAKEGDILVIYPDMTIIYDPINKTVIDIANTKLLK